MNSYLLRKSIKFLLEKESATTATMPVITHVLKYRVGQMWNIKLAFLQRRLGFRISQFLGLTDAHTAISQVQEGISWGASNTAAGQ